MTLFIHCCLGHENITKATNLTNRTATKRPTNSGIHRVTTVKELQNSPTFARLFAARLPKLQLPTSYLTYNRVLACIMLPHTRIAPHVKLAINSVQLTRFFLHTSLTQTVNFPRLPGQLSNSTTFPGFPDNWSP